VLHSCSLRRIDCVENVEVNFACEVGWKRKLQELEKATKQKKGQWTWKTNVERENAKTYSFPHKVMKKKMIVLMVKTSNICKMFSKFYRKAMEIN